MFQKIFGFVIRTYRTKTFQILAAGLAGIAQQYFSGQLSGKAALAGVIFCLYGIFQRDAAAKAEAKNG